jgi:hypothetical protein
LPEEQTVQGNRWTKRAVTLLESLGWQLKGDVNIDIPCTIHPGRSQDHGIDSFLTYFDPYQNCLIGVINETKHYAWDNVSQSKIQEWVDTLIETLDCVPHTDEFVKRLNFDRAKIDTGLLLIWYHDRFEKEKFYSYLKNLKIPRKLKSLRIYILSNDQILKLYSISHAIKLILLELSDSEKFDIYYPSYPKTDSFKSSNFIGLEYFRSKFIFGKLIKVEKFNGGSRSKNITVVFYFDQLDYDCLAYMYLALRRFQLTEEEIWIYHYDDQSVFRSPVKEFEREFGQNQKKVIKFIPMEHFDRLPKEV